MKFLSQNDRLDVKSRRRWFAGLLWRTFPGDSLREKAQRAAPVLDLSARQVEKLINEEHDAKLGTVLTVLAIAGAENIFDILGGQDAARSGSRRAR